MRSRFAAGFMAIYMIILAYAAWVMQQPMGKYSSTGHAKRVAPAFIAPILAFGVYRVTDRLRSLFDQRADAQIKRLKEKLRKMVAELKDSTRYQRTQALIEKYDPEQQQKMMATRSGAGGAGLTPEERKLQMQSGNGSNPSGSTFNGRGLVPSSSGRKLADRATSAAATAVSGAGAALSSALGQLVSSAAKNLIGDEPMMVEMLKQAQTQARELERENAELRQLLGWPQRAASNTNIAANLGSSGAGGGGGNGGGGGGGGGDFAFGSPVSQNPDPDALLESPRALSPPSGSLSKKEKKNKSRNVLEKDEEVEEESEDNDGTPPAAANSSGVRRSRRRS